ncbi:MAG: hypothetical protein IKU40_03205 [Clostridia bacterium]|nr:hypothetical protein [Clostridia bacterium]
MKVLFVGNSHTYVNDMPELFARFAEKTTGEKPEVVMLAYGGRDYDWHLREYTSLRFNLMYGGFDYCVLQQAAHPYPPIETTLKTGAEIISLCHRCGVKPVVYMTWAEKRFPENQQKMIDTCEKLAGENDALLAPVGRIWQEVQQTRPDIELYHTDGEHAGPYGDFLIAAVFCRLLAGKVSADVSGMGFNFHVCDETGRNTVDPELILTELDREKTDHILDIVNK